MRKLAFVTALALALAGLTSPSVASPDETKAVTVESPSGPVLVDKLVVLFEQMAASKARIDPVLDELMASAKKARAEQRVDARFFARYTRLLRVFKLMTLDDKEGILRSVADRECTSLIKDVEGAEAECSVPALAKAITHELQRLKE